MALVRLLTLCMLLGGIAAWADVGNGNGNGNGIGNGNGNGNAYGHGITAPELSWNTLGAGVTALTIGGLFLRRKKSR